MFFSRWIGCFVLFVCMSSTIQAQFHMQRIQPLKANSRWFLGNYELDFNQSFPALNKADAAFDALYNTYGNFYNAKSPNVKKTNVISVSHPQSGEFLFLATSNMIFDRSMAPLLNGNFTNNLSSDDFYEKSVVVVPFVNDNNKYYYISLSKIKDSIYLNYSVVNLNLNNGKGAVELKNTFINKVSNDVATELIDVVPGNNCDYWLLLTENRSDKLEHNIKAFNITASGINTTPVVSTFRKISENLLYWDYQISPNRNLISFLSNEESNHINFFRFNVENGIVTQDALPSIILKENGFGTRTIFTPDNNYFLVYSNIYENQEATFYKYDLRSYVDEYKFSSFKYSFKYTPFNSNEHVIYLPPIISFKSYKDKIFFSVPQSVVTPAPLDPSQFIVSISGGATKLVMLEAESNNQWEKINIGSEIPLSKLCWLFTNSNVVYPYTPADTLQSVYIDSVLCLLPNTSLPEITMNAKPGFSDYIWNDGTIGPEKTINATGKYWVYYKGQCNYRVDTFSYRLWIPDDILGTDTIVCEQRFPIKIKANYTERLLWDDNSYNLERTIEEPGSYWVQFKKFGCIQNDTISIGSKYCPCGISLPNAFTPNRDGINDYFKPVISLGCVPSGYNFRIFNRWGQLVYSSFNEFDQGWDGIYNGREADAGSYYYEIRFKSKFLENDYYSKGELILIR